MKAMSFVAALLFAATMHTSPATAQRTGLAIKCQKMYPDRGSWGEAMRKQCRDANRKSPSGRTGQRGKKKR